jgi:hypothetical protein
VVEAALAASGGVAEQFFHNHGFILPADVGPRGATEEVRSFGVEQSMGRGIPWFLQVPGV